MAPAPRIAVLSGGTSAERDISLESGRRVVEALTSGGYSLTSFDPGETSVSEIPWNRFDVAFLAMHGTYGEDGTLQRELDQLGVCYTGSGALASWRAFHKEQAKLLFARQGLLTPRWRSCSSQLMHSELIPLARGVGYPLIVKPEAQGSSLGVSLVNSPSELEQAVAAVRPLDERCLLEQAIPGEEWTVPVLDQQVLRPIRILTDHTLFDFSAKYHDEQTVQEVVRDDSPKVREICQLALDAATVLGCRGLSRVDLRVDGQGYPWLLEVNTIPGLTSHSLVPRSARSCGWDMTELCSQMILAAQTSPRRLNRSA